jgi:hypothetical protein
MSDGLAVACLLSCTVGVPQLLNVAASVNVLPA